MGPDHAAELMGLECDLVSRLSWFQEMSPTSWSGPLQGAFGLLLGQLGWRRTGPDSFEGSAFSE